MPHGYHRGGGARQERRSGLDYQRALEAASYLADEKERRAGPGVEPFKNSRKAFVDFHAEKFQSDPEFFDRGHKALERKRAYEAGTAEERRAEDERAERERRREATRWPHAAGCRCERLSPRPCPGLHTRELDFKTFTTGSGLGFHVKLNHEERLADLDERRWLDLPQWVETIGGEVREAYDLAHRSYGEEVFERIELEEAQRLCDAQPVLVQKYGTRRFLALFPIQWKLRDQFAHRVLKLAKEAEGAWR